MAGNSLTKLVIVSALLGYTLGIPTIASAQSGIASVYSEGRTATGEKVLASALTAAHKTLPFGTMVRVTNATSGADAVVNNGQIAAPVTPAAARAIGCDGLARVTVDVVGKDGSS